MERLSLKGRLPPISILGVSEDFLQRLRLSFDVTMLRGMVEERLHCFLQLDVGLSS